jgi:hypothetical protein
MMNNHIFDFAKPETAIYDIEFVAEMLGKKCRFGDHVVHHYSVAEHCCHAHDLYPRNRKGALLHDAPEFVMGDLITPLKRDADSFKATEHRIMRDMEYRFAFEEPDEMTFKLVDNLLFHQEETFLYPDIERVYDIDIPFALWSPEKAAQEFLDRFYKCSVTRYAPL